jgi:hypothetical protein
MASRWSFNKTGPASVIVISLLQFGQISIVRTTDDIGLVFIAFPFAQRMRSEQRATLAWVPVSLKNRSWKLSRPLCDSSSVVNIMRLPGARVEILLVVDKTDEITRRLV